MGVQLVTLKLIFLYKIYVFYKEIYLFLYFRKPFILSTYTFIIAITYFTNYSS